MGERGPQPKPTALRILEGNPSKRSLNKFEPKPNPVCSTPPPAYFSEYSKGCWNRAVEILGRIGVLTEADLPLLERYCDFLNDFRRAREFLSTVEGLWYPMYERDLNGEICKTKDGKPIIKEMKVFPQLAQKLRVSEHLLRIEQHFGMTPAARSRIRLAPGTDPGATPPDDDPFAVQ